MYCEYDPETKSGTEGGNRKVKSTINWVEINSSVEADVRLYDRLFAIEDPSASDKDFRDLLNPDSLKVVTGCRVEAALAQAKPLDKFQFVKEYLKECRISAANNYLRAKAYQKQDRFQKWFQKLKVILGLQLLKRGIMEPKNKLNSFGAQELVW